MGRRHHIDEQVRTIIRVSRELLTSDTSSNHLPSGSRILLAGAAAAAPYPGTTALPHHLLLFDYFSESRNAPQRFKVHFSRPGIALLLVKPAESKRQTTTCKYIYPTKYLAPNSPTSPLTQPVTRYSSTARLSHLSSLRVPIRSDLLVYCCTAVK